MRIKRFEELEIWKISRELYQQVLEITSRKSFINDFRFRDQIRSSSGSISDNIAEGFDRGGNKEFGQFLSISKGSCGELRNQCYRAFDNKYISEQELEELLDKTDNLSGKISRLMIYLKKGTHKGAKFD